MNPNVRIARPAELEQLGELVLAANPHLTDRIANFRKHGYYWHDVVPVVCEVQGQLASCACIFKRSLRVGETEAAFCGIGAVATHPNFRRRGLATDVLEKCETLMAGWGVEVSVLFCSIVDFYAQQGWSAVEDRMAEFDMPSNAGPVDFGDYGVRPIQLDEISGPLRAIADSQSAIPRNPETWRQYASWRKEDPDLIFGASVDHELVAYVRGKRTGPGEFRLLDAAWLPDHGRAMMSLLRMQAELVNGNSRARCRVFLSPEHPLCALLEAAGMRVGWRQIPPEMGVMMVKSIRAGGGAGRGHLQREAFDSAMPWRPRSWWGIDRF